MHLISQSTAQVYSPFGTYVVEQHDKGFETGRRFDVPEPETVPPSSTWSDVETRKAA